MILDDPRHMKNAISAFVPWTGFYVGLNVGDGWGENLLPSSRALLIDEIRSHPRARRYCRALFRLSAPANR